MRNLRQPRVRAPKLTGRGWINTAAGEDGVPGEPDLSGRIVLLDFWKSSTIHRTSKRMIQRDASPSRM